MSSKIIHIKHGALEFNKAHKKGFFQYAKDTFITVSYEYKGMLSTLHLDISKGVITDFASVPSIFRFVLKNRYKDDDDNIAALVHDVLYNFGGKDLDRQIVDWEQANWLFKAIMEYYKVGNRLTRYLGYKAVSSPAGYIYFIDTNNFDKVNAKLITWTWL